MPKVIIDVVYAVGTYLYSISPVLLATVQSAILSTVSSKLFGPKVPKGIGKSLRVMTRSALEHRKIVYGQAMVSGPIFYNNVSGTNNEYLWYGIALCDGESEDIISVWFDGEAIPQADIAWTPGIGGADGAGTGDVSTAKFVGENSTAGAQIYYYLGHADQVVSGNLNSTFADIDTNHRLRGITHIICKLLYDEDTEKVWSSGPPRNITAVVKGRKIYDPRLDSTQVINTGTSPLTYGSGAQRTTDSTTWVWSDNPALCVADYLTQIMGVATTSIDWPSIAAAADDCEVAAVISTSSPETTEDRFTCNGALSMGSSHKDNLDSLISSMDGRLAYSGGVWKLRASVWEASTITLTEDDLAGDVQVRGSAPKSERFNGVRGFFIDPDRNYEAVEFPHVSSATYVTRDNGKTIMYDLQLPMTNSVTMAQRLAYRNLEQGNNQVIAQLKLNARGSKIAVGDVVSVTLDNFSWSAKTFRCVEWNRNEDSTFSVTLREDASTDYDDPAGSAYGIAGAGGVTKPTDVVPPPTGLTATNNVGGIRLDWTNPTNSAYDYIDIYEDTDSAWSGAAKIASVRANTFFVPRATGTTYYYWVRAVKAPADESLRSPDSDTSTVSGAASGGSDGESIFYASVYLRKGSAPTEPVTDDGSYNFTTKTLTPPSISGGSADDWSATVPAGSNPLYVCHGTFSITGVTGTDSTVDWSAPTIMAQDGAAGADGAVAVYVNQFIRSSGAPATPGTTSASYNFDTTPGTFTPTSSWSAGVPSAGSPTLPIYVSTAQFYSSDGTGTDSSTTWSTPQKLAEDGADGASGSDGLSVHVSTVYKRDTSAPSTPTGGSYNFTTTTLTAPTGWTEAIPSGSDPLYASTATWSITGVTGTDSSTTWSTPAQVTSGDPADPRITPVGGAALDSSITPTNARAEFKIDNDGDTYTKLGTASYVSKGTWLGTGVVGDYEVALFDDGGSSDGAGGSLTPSGEALATWLSCSTDRSWYIEDTSSSGTAKLFYGTVKWRDDTTYEILGQASMRLRAFETV